MVKWGVCHDKSTMILALDCPTCRPSIFYAFTIALPFFMHFLALTVYSAFIPKENVREGICKTVLT